MARMAWTIGVELASIAHYPLFRFRAVEGLSSA